MPARFYDVENHHDDEEDFIKKHRDMDLGDGIAVGLALYYNITDIEKLKKLVGKETTFFKRTGFEMALDKVAGVVDGDTVDEITSKRNDFLTRSQLIKKGEGYEKLLTKWFDGKTGELVKGSEKDFIDMLNVFVPEPNQQTVDIANQLIKQAITQLTNIHKKTEDPDNPQNSKVQDEAGDPTANFAQLVANLMSWWGGAAAKADTGVAAVNGMSKLKWVKSYKYKSTDPGRAGPIGNLYGMGNVQEVYVDVLTGMLTVDGKSVMEIVEQKIKDLKSGKSFEEKEKTAHQFNFNLNTAKQYGAAHATNANKIYLMEGGADMPHFHDFVDVNQWGTIRINADKMATEMQDKIIKPVRYAWSTHKMPFHKDVRKRIQDDPKAPEGMKDKYITVSQLENTFSRQVIKIGQEMFKHDMHHKFNMKADDPKAVEYFDTNAHAKFYDEKAGRVYRFKVNENGDYVDKNGKVYNNAKMCMDCGELCLIG
jgi:hypothetical protein